MTYFSQFSLARFALMCTNLWEWSSTHRAESVTPSFQNSNEDKGNYRLVIMIQCLGSLWIKSSWNTFPSTWRTRRSLGADSLGSPRLSCVSPTWLCSMMRGLAIASSSANNLKLFIITLWHKCKMRGNCLNTLQKHKKEIGDAIQKKGYESI